MTLALHFGITGATIYVLGAPDEPRAEEIARAVLESGYQPYPVGGRVTWDALVAAGLEHGVIEKAPARSKGPPLTLSPDRTRRRSSDLPS
jgi:hypothetical protein